jgi:hypothetical protein
VLLAKTLRVKTWQDLLSFVFRVLEAVTFGLNYNYIDVIDVNENSVFFINNNCFCLLYKNGGLEIQCE